MKKFRLLFRDFIATIRTRWRNHMPVFFRRVFWVCSLISGTALAVNTAITMGGGFTHQWWQDIYPYLLGFPAGIAFACKFTQQYSGKPVDYKEYRRAERTGRTVLDHMHGTPPQPQCPTVSPSESSPAASASGEEEMFDILPYDDRPNA